jgi:mono/diheme cytochrome c family protein
MNFLAITFPVLGDRLIIAIIAIIHVLVSHGLAVGGSFFIVMVEYKSIREDNKRLNDAAYYLARWFFILTTSVGALTGVGIWFVTNVFSPVGIGSLLRLFFWVWFIEWFVFVAELSMVATYYLTWSRMPPRKHLRVGITYVILSFLTLVAIVGILGFMLTPGRWLTTRSFWPAFFNPSYVPQLFSRATMAGLLACTFCLLIYSLMPSFRDLREEFYRFSGKYLMIASPLFVFFTFAYFEILSHRAREFLPVAFTTMQLTEYAQWSEAFLFLVSGFLFLTGLFLLTTRKTFVILTFLPLLLLATMVAQYERVREFVRKPYVIEDYLYSNGIRKEEAPFLSQKGVLTYFTWAKQAALSGDGKVSEGKALYLVECSVCHTYRGVNGIFNKGAIVGTPKAALQFLDNMHVVYPFMPPFIGTQEEKEVLAEFLAQGNATK